MSAYTADIFTIYSDMYVGFYADKINSYLPKNIAFIYRHLLSNTDFYCIYVDYYFKAPDSDLISQS